MFSCDAYAYLDVDDPHCAWATARGVLVSARMNGPEPGFISVMMAGLLRSGNEARLSNELRIEAIRQRVASSAVSRLSGIFCFTDRVSARAIEGWGGHFTPEYFTEGRIQATHLTALDANWITYAPNEAGILLPEADDWIARYWKGEAYPKLVPIWEVVAHGRFVIFDTEIRHRAFKRIEEEFPDSLGILELGRAAAWIGSDLGNPSAWLMQDGDDVACHYIIDMRDAGSKAFQERLISERALKNHHLLRRHMEQGSFGRTPNMEPYEFRRSRHNIAIPDYFNHLNSPRKTYSETSILLKQVN